MKRNGIHRNPRLRAGAPAARSPRAAPSPRPVQAWLLLRNRYSGGEYVGCSVYGLVREDTHRFARYSQYVEDETGYFLVAPRPVTR